MPRYVGNGARIRRAEPTDIAEGLETADELIGLLPRLRLVVPLGRKAEKARGHPVRSRRNMRFLSCPHPSPRFVNLKPGNRARILEAFVEVRSLLDR